MYLFRRPRCCEVVGLGSANSRRFVLQVGAAQPELAAELSRSAAEDLADAVDVLVGRLATPAATGLGLPPRPVVLSLARLTLDLVDDEARLRGFATDVDREPVLEARLTPDVARALAASCRAALAQRRPLCPFCGLALEPAGHVCPRANGFRR